MKAKAALYSLLVFVPASLGLGLAHASPVAVFVVSCLAIVPLAGIMGEATESLAHRAGPGLGGLLNATFGNAAELIIGVIALRAGEAEVVKASLTGSIIGNLLVVLGLSMFLGGLRHHEMRFSRLAAETGSGMMVLAVVALVIPAIYAQVTRHSQPAQVESISLDISWVLMLSYLASLVFQLRTHRHLFAPEGTEEARRPAAGPGRRSIAGDVLVLLAAAGLTAAVSELLVGALDAAGGALGLGKVFMGVVVVAVVGNAAEHSTAVVAALKNKMDLALGIAMGSSMQIALFVAPVLVVAGHAIGRPLGLEFTLLEVAAVVLSVFAVANLVQDGRTNWFEGVQLLAIYGILAVTFFFV